MVTRLQVVLAASALFLVFPLLLTISLYYFSLQHAGDISSPYLKSMILKAQQNEAHSHVLEQDNVGVLAVKLGQMQAQMLRLGALGERLAKMAGLKSQEFSFEHPPGQGGALPALPQSELSLAESREQLQALSLQIDQRADQMAVLEAMLSQEHQKNIRLPSSPPVLTTWHSSDFGWRIDPFSGKKTFHEGVDFSAEVGTPVNAAAGGIVVYSDYHPDYGNMVEIDHGNGMVSRYAHASRRLVKVGDIVLKAQEIAKVGNTGRSTGSHLHFEVRFKGAPQNPALFLQAAK